MVNFDREGDVHGQRTRRCGATIVEYAILLMLIAMGAMLAVLQLGGGVRDLFSGLTNEIPAPVPDGEGPETASITAVLPPPAGRYEPGDVLRYVVRFSEPVAVTRDAGIPDMPVDIDGTRRLAEDDGTGHDDIRVFTYTVQPGDPKPADVTTGPRIDPDGDTIVTADAGKDVDLTLPGADSAIQVADTPAGPFDVLESATSAYPEDQAVAPDGGWFMVRNIPFIYSFAPDGSLRWVHDLNTTDNYPEYDLIDATADGGVVAAGSSGDNHYVARLGADGSVEWARRFTLEDGSIDAVMETPDGDVVAVGDVRDSFRSIYGFIVRLSGSGDLEASLRFRNDEDTGRDRDTDVKVARLGPYKIGIAGTTGDRSLGWPGSYFLTIPTDFGPALSAYRARAIYQRSYLGTFGRDEVVPTALANDGVRWWYVAKILSYPGSSKTEYWLVQDLGGGAAFGARSFYNTEVPTNALAVLDNEIIAAGGVDTDGDSVDDTAALYEFDYGSLVYTGGRTLSGLDGNREWITTMSEIGGGVVFGGGAGSFTDQYHVDMLVGRIGRLSEFTCADDVGDCADVPPLMADAPERNTTVHWSAEMPDDTRRMQFDTLSGIALQNVSNITTVTGRMPASDKLHDFFPF